MTVKRSIPPEGYYLAPHVTILEIQQAVSDRFAIPMIEMVSARRSREVARPRQIAMYLARELTPHSLPAIGRYFGGRDHTTILHAIRTIGALKDIDREMRETVETLRQHLTPENSENQEISSPELEAA